MDTIFQALEQTPFWVYLLFGFLLSRGISSSYRERRVSTDQIFIVPCLIFTLSLYSLFKNFHPSCLSLASWIGSTALGLTLGFFHYKTLGVRFDKENNTFVIPGTITTLLLILLIFSAKYYFSYQLAIDPKLLEQKEFEFFMLFISGMSAGCFLGRLAFCLKIKA